MPGTGCGEELLLQNGTDSGVVTHESCGTVRAEGSYQVGATEDVTLRAGKRVVLGDGFSVASGGRLTVGTDLALDPEGEPTDASQSFSYYRFGNLLSVTTEREGQSPETRTIGTNASTNRLTVATYDLSGNVTSWSGRTYSYDPFSMVWQTRPTNGNGHTFLYGPGDERLWTIDWSAGTAVANWVETWTLRDLGGSPLRQYRSVGGNVSGGWSLQRDYVWRGGGLLAAHTPEGLQHFHLDHLSSPRIITDSSGQTLAEHLYFPFGEEATDPGQDAETLKFTGHERDDLDASGSTRDLDYMHARSFSAHLGRFFSPDKVPQIGKAIKSPQRWNLYTYVASNPLKYIDPSGNILLVPNAKEVKDALDELFALQQALLEAGAEQAAETLRAEVVNGEVRITSGGIDLSDSDNPTVALIGSAINTETRVGLQITNRDLSSHGGALTESVGPRDDPNRITISINPSQLSSTVAPGRVAAGPLTGMQLGLTYSAGTALVHELGHAYGYYEQGYDRFPVWGQTNATALRYENLHRALIADPRGPLLARYPVERVRH